MFDKSFHEKSAIFADRRLSDRQNLRKNEVEVVAGVISYNQFFNFNLNSFIM